MGDKALYAAGRYADPSLFDMFTLSFVQGNPANPFPQLYSIVLTEKTAARFFGPGKDILGKTVRIDNEQDYIVSGVIKDLPENSTLQFDWLAPYQSEMQLNFKKFGHYDDHWDSYGPVTCVELAPFTDPAVVNRRLYDYIHHKDAAQTRPCFLFPLRDWHLYAEFAGGKETGGGRISQIRLLSLIAWVILLIACINFMNLSTARSERRAKEIGVRKVLGSGRSGLIGQFISESLWMSAMATTLAVLLIAMTLPAFNTLVQQNLVLDLSSPIHLAGLLLITVTCGLLAGSYPSLYLSSFNPVHALKGLTIKRGGAALRQGLVVLQFTVSVVFIFSTIIIYLQVRHAKDRNLGFDKDNLLEIDMQHGIADNFPVLEADLLQTGTVDNVAMADNATIYGGNSDNRFRWPRKAPDHSVDISFRHVSSGFISTMGMQIVQGKDFADDVSDSVSVIVNKTLADLIDKHGVVGSVIQSPRDMKEGAFKNVKVVGVVSDYVFGNMYGRPAPLILFCKLPNPNNPNLVYVRIKDRRNARQTLEEIAAVMKKDNPAYPFQYRFVDDQFNELFSGEVQMSKLSSIFAVLAIIISCLGLFGLAAYTTEQRTREIGVRKVLGASVARITGLLSKDFLQLVILSCLLALPLGWWIMHDWLQGYEYRIVISWWIFLLAGAAALLISWLTVSFLTIRAAIVNPVKSLRTE